MLKNNQDQIFNFNENKSLSQIIQNKDEINKNEISLNKLNGKAHEETGKRPNAFVKPLKTSNIISKNDTFDTLHQKAVDVSILNLKDTSVKAAIIKGHLRLK